MFDIFFGIYGLPTPMGRSEGTVLIPFLLQQENRDLLDSHFMGTCSHLRLPCMSSIRSSSSGWSPSSPASSLPKGDGGERKAQMGFAGLQGPVTSIGKMNDSNRQNDTVPDPTTRL